MSQPTYTEDDYHEMIDGALNQSPEDRRFAFYPLNYVADPQEWARFKAALLRWLAEQDDEHRRAFDQHAQEQEHDEPDV